MFGVKVDNSKCTQCGLCVSHCKVDIKEVGDQECISCGECIGVCPTQAIHWKGIRKTQHTDDSRHKKAKLVTRVITLVVMAGMLIGAGIYYWQQPEPVTVTQGSEVGQLCYGEELQIITPEGIQQDTLDPTQTGKVTVINFWGTWCTPCCAELPFFQQVAEEYADDVSIFAVHSYLLAEETAAAYISANYADSAVQFLADYDGDGNGTSGYYTQLGGRGTYPYTVVLDEEGVITKIFVSSVTYDMLKEAVDQALN